MSFFIDHPKARWVLPVAAVGVIGATALTVNQTANADSGLPSRTAAQLLADVRSANVSSLSGTVVQTSDLGLPEIPGLGSSGRPGSASSSLTSLISGTHTWRVWLDGPTRQRLALIGSNGESDVIHNGTDVWLWSSADKTAVHHKLSADQVRAGSAGKRLPSGLPSGVPSTLPSGAPRTPDEAAGAALALMGKDTTVTTSGTASVAGRSAYELVLTPKDKTTLVGSVRIAIDSQEHVPLRVQVYSTKLTNPAFEVGFTAVDFAQARRSAVRVHAAGRHHGHRVRRADRSQGRRQRPTRRRSSRRPTPWPRCRERRRSSAPGGARSSWPRSPSRPAERAPGGPRPTARPS